MSRMLFAAVVAASSMALSGCQDAGQGLSKIGAEFSDALKRRYGNMDDPQAGTTAFKSSKIYGALKSKPFDPTKPFAEQYPRVAFTILSSPPNHAEIMPEFLNIPNAVTRGCYKISAVIWTSKTQSEKIEPFNWCAPNDFAYEKPCRDVTDWAGRTAFYPMDENTSTNRTDGPIPPLMALPTQVEATGGAYRDSHTLDEQLVCSIVYGSGLDPHYGQDRRVWLKSGPKFPSR